MTTQTKRMFFSSFEWERLRRYGMADIKLLITLKNLVNKHYYQNKNDHKLNTKQKENLWFKSLNTVFLEHFSKNSNEEQYHIFSDAVRKINNRLRLNKKERERVYLARQLDLAHHEHQLYAPGLPLGSPEYEEFKEQVLHG